MEASRSLQTSFARYVLRIFFGFGEFVIRISSRRAVAPSHSPRFAPVAAGRVGFRNSGFGLSFVAPGAPVDLLIDERFLVQRRHLVGAGVFPGCDVSKILVVALRFAVRGLKFLSEMAAAGFAA